jgi:hypothetical protein
MPIILATWEPEMGRITVWSWSQQVCETPSQQMAWFRCVHLLSLIGRLRLKSHGSRPPLGDRGWRDKSSQDFISMEKKTGHSGLCLSSQQWGKMWNLISKIRKKKDGGVTQVVVHQPQKCKALSSNPSATYHRITKRIYWVGFVILVWFLRQGLAVYPRLALNLWSFYFSLQNARITGMYHHTQLKIDF